MCKICDTGQFCSTKCAENHKNHKEFCSIIASVQQIESEKVRRNSIDVVDSEKLPYKLKKKLISDLRLADVTTLSPEEKKKIVDLFIEFSDILALKYRDIGNCKLFQVG